MKKKIKKSWLDFKAKFSRNVYHKSATDCFFKNKVQLVKKAALLKILM